MKQALRARPNWRQSPGRLAGLLLARFMWFDAALQQGLEDAGWGSVRRLESMTMVYVGAGVTRPTELARLIGVTRQSINSALRELELKGLVHMAPDPSDKRCKIVKFAPEGEEMRAAAEKVMRGLEETLSERIGEQALDDLDLVLGAAWGKPPGTSSR